MIRMSTAQVFQNGIDQILQRQSQVHASQSQIASGRRVSVPSDDPLAAAQIMRLNTELTQIDQYDENANLAMTQLSYEENAITSVQNELQRYRELVLQASNASQSVDDRNAVRVELEQITNQILSTANSKNPTGDYLFSGYQTKTNPFELTETGTVYQGDSGSRYARIGSRSEVLVGDAGNKVFMGMPSGNGDFSFSAAPSNTGTAFIGTNSANNAFVADDYQIAFFQLTPDDPVTYEVFDSGGTSVTTGNYTDGDFISFAGAAISIDGVPADGDLFNITPSAPKDLFSTLRQITDALGTYGDSGDEHAILSTELALGLENIDRAMDHLSEVRTDIGARLGRIDSQLSLNADFELRVETSLSELEDLDLTEAISQLNLELTTLEAAQQAYISVQGLSLFNYI